MKTTNEQEHDSDYTTKCIVSKNKEIPGVLNVDFSCAHPHQYKNAEDPDKSIGNSYSVSFGLPSECLNGEPSDDPKAELNTRMNSILHDILSPLITAMQGMFMQGNNEELKGLATINESIEFIVDNEASVLFMTLPVGLECMDVKMDVDLSEDQLQVLAQQSARMLVIASNLLMKNHGTGPRIDPSAFCGIGSVEICDPDTVTATEQGAGEFSTMDKQDFN